MSMDIKDFTKNLIEWWRTDKLTSTLSPIVITLNILKFRTGTNYTDTELIANGFMIILMLFSIRYYYKRHQIDALQTLNYTKYKLSIESEERIEMRDLDIRDRELKQKKEIEDFAMDIVEKQRVYQFGLLAKRANFIYAQIMENVNSIVYLAKNFNLAEQPAIKHLITMHEKNIESLRKELETLPIDIKKSFKDFVSDEDVLGDINVSKQIGNEVDAVISTIVSNAHIAEAIDDIEGIEHVSPPPEADVDDMEDDV